MAKTNAIERRNSKSEDAAIEKSSAIDALDSAASAGIQAARPPSLKEYIDKEDTAKFPFLFIVTYGRSGSTLLQGILNSIPGYTIHGENNSALYPVFIAAKSLADAKNKFGKKGTKPSDAWYGAHKLEVEGFEQGLLENFFATCLRPGSQTKCIGFKEIRYTGEHIPNGMLEPYLEFIQQAFRGAAIIFNIRNINDTVKSAWWQNYKLGSVRALLSTTESNFKAYASKHENCFIFDYDSLMADRAYCRGLFDFLGEKFDPHALDQVINVKHSYEPDAPPVAVGPTLSRDSRSQEEKQYISQAKLRKTGVTAVAQRSRAEQLQKRLRAETVRRQARARELRQVRQKLRTKTQELRKTKQGLKTIENSFVVRVLMKIGLIARAR